MASTKRKDNTGEKQTIRGLVSFFWVGGKWPHPCWLTGNRPNSILRGLYQNHESKWRIPACGTNAPFGCHPLPFAFRAWEKALSSGCEKSGPLKTTLPHRKGPSTRTHRSSRIQISVRGSPWSPGTSRHHRPETRRRRFASRAWGPGPRSASASAPGRSLASWLRRERPKSTLRCRWGSGPHPESGKALTSVDWQRTLGLPLKLPSQTASSPGTEEVVYGSFRNSGFILSKRLARSLRNCSVPSAKRSA